MTTAFADRVAVACRGKGNSLCVGIDPRPDLLPLGLRVPASEGLEGLAAAYETFSLRVLELVAPLVPIVKPQSAFFEACGPAGMKAQQRILQRARELGLLTILDNKRNDVASTAEAYADAAFAGTLLDGVRHPIWQADSMTINPYMGRDAVEPFIAAARRTQGGVFVLVRTSNKGAGQFQNLESDGKPLYRHVAEAVGAWANEQLASCGYGDVGAVVGATHPRELALIRQWIPQVVFLVPGYGAQGGGAADVAAGFRDDGLGAIINSSRGIIAAFKPDDAKWETKIVDAAKAAIDDLRQSTPMGKLRG
ncbi:MAG: orotidine-5'-phosphate decarboxylase [Gemmataceae bacterium]|nr:orotidine-5'-phosphate decarboxylase [Gemmataceae bacterium]